MAPNLFLCLRTVFCPIYWFQRGDRIQGSIQKEEHWDSPVPGVYRYIPGHGWHLIYRDGNQDDEKFPKPVVYCRILHRYLFEDEMAERCSWHWITPSVGAKPEHLRFFRLDDGHTWVAGWDAKGRFIPGPYQKWRFDSFTNTMRPRKSPPESTDVSRSSSIVPNKYD